MTVKMQLMDSEENIGTGEKKMLNRIMSLSKFPLAKNLVCLTLVILSRFRDLCFLTELFLNYIDEYFTFIHSAKLKIKLR